MVDERSPADPRDPYPRPRREVGKTGEDNFLLNLAEYREEENSHTANFFNLLNELRENVALLGARVADPNDSVRGQIRVRAEAFVEKVLGGLEAKIKWEGQPWAGLNADDVPMEKKWEYAHNLKAAEIEPWVIESRILVYATKTVPLRKQHPFMIIDSMLKEEGLLPEEVENGQETQRPDERPEIPSVLVPTGPGRWGPKPLLRAGASAARGADLDRRPGVGPGERPVPGRTLGPGGRPRRQEADPPGGERGQEPGEGDEPDEPREP